MAERELKVLRDQPGIAQIEFDLNRVNALWAPENDDIDARCDRVSQKLFGITLLRTLHECHDDDEDDMTDVQIDDYNEWEAQFDTPEDPTETYKFWRERGWDVLDADRKQLLKCLPVFERQMLFQLAGLKPRPQSALRQKFDEEEQAERLNEWGGSLEEDARRFASSGGRRRSGR